jgi:predicted Zn-dependent protease with MMP-like domain
MTSATKPNRVMLFRETVAVYCENRTEHTDTLCGQNAVYINPARTSQGTHDISAGKPNRLMLVRETVAVYCENRTEHTDTLCGQNAVYINSVCTSQETAYYVSAT